MADSGRPGGSVAADGPDGGGDSAGGAGALGAIARADGPPDPLAVLAAGTFHVALLVVALVVVFQAEGVLGDALVGFGTVPGAAAYFVLWGVGWWATRRAVVETGRRGRGGVAAAVVAGVKWGAVAAAGFFLVVTVPGAIGFVLAAPAPVAAVALPVAVGTAVAATVGSLVGGLLALLDVALLRVATRVAVPRTDER